MSSVENPSASAPTSAAKKPGFWQALKRGLIRTEQDFAVFKLAILSVVGTLIGAYFQNLSTYNDKVAAQAKDDMTAAEQGFADASSALSVPLALQKQLILGYNHAIATNTDSDSTAYETANARSIYKSYTDAYSSLSQNYNLLARRMELYVDWPSNPYRDPATDSAPTTDVIDMSLLNTFGFDCEKNMPSFQKPDPKDKNKDDSNKDESKVTLTDPHDSKNTLTIDWYSAKHNVLTIETCFEITHEAMTPVLQWASGNPVDRAARTKFIDTNFGVFDTRSSNQVLRLNAFMSLVMFDIDKIRVKYRPNSYQCSLPIVRSVLAKTCMPVRTAGPLT
jgi:hypothetical protein